MFCRCFNIVDCFFYRDGMLYQFDEKKDKDGSPRSTMSLRYAPLSSMRVSKRASLLSSVSQPKQIYIEQEILIIMYNYR